jgi:hypothetical protein
MTAVSIVTGLAAVLAVPGPGGSAAADCLPQPGAQTAAGGHWFYRIDHANNNRKCWYLAQSASVPLPVRAAPAPVPEPAPSSGFSSFFSSLIAPSSSPPETRPAWTPSAPPPDYRDDEGDRRPRALPQPDTTASAAPHRPSRPRPADKSASRSLTPAERDTLFREFLEWKQHKTP